MTFIIITFFLISAVIQSKKLIAKGFLRELVVYYIFLSAAVTISILFVYHIHTPSPEVPIQHLVKDILHLNYK